MQIRELNLKELDIAYEILSQLRTELSYKEFEDLIYEMRHMEYKMIGIFENEKLITYAGVAIQTNLYHKRHLYVYDLVTDSALRTKGYAKMMLDYLVDFSRVAMCENIVLSSGLQRIQAHKFYENYGFDKKSYIYILKN